MILTLRGVRRGLALLAAGTGLAAAGSAAAQIDNLPPGAVVQPLPDRGAGAELRRHLTALAENPRSASALVGAGRAALELGDTEAAIGFFARAEEVAPRDARVKAGMASSLVQMEQGQAALQLFAEAVALGAPEIEIAADRGLAYDMVGDPRRAQQDYALVLRSRENPEVRRRMALSLAISGQREAAMAMIDEQLRQQDRGAWRTRAFILALTGDGLGAHQAAQATMPSHAAQAMAPFFARLSALDPAQKAAAVHFGRFPTAGQSSRMASSNDTSAYPGAVALAEGRATPAGTAGLRPRNPGPQPVSNEPRRRPGSAEAEPARRRSLTGRPSRNRQVRLAEPQREAARAPQTQRQPVRIAQAQPSQPVPSAAPPRQAQPAPPAQQPEGGTRPAEDGPENERDFQEIAALVSELPVERAQPARATRPAAAPAQAAEARPAAPAHPSRHWVQIAGGADRSALPREFSRLKDMAPDLLGSRTAYTTPLRLTNRLLVGPFDSEGEAQEFVNRLAAEEVAAFAWTSPAGQEIERLPNRR